MKKIFTIISSILMSFILVFVMVICFVKVNLKININQPTTKLLIYNQSKTATLDLTLKEVAGTSISTSQINSNKQKANEIMSQFFDMTNLSIFKWLINNNDLKNDLKFCDKVPTFEEEIIKKSNIVLELIYDQTQNIIVQQDGNDRVIPFISLFIVIKINQDFGDVVIYYSRNSGSAERLKQYANADNIPLTFKANTKSFVNYINSL